MKTNTLNAIVVIFLCFIALSSIHQLTAIAEQIRSDSLVSDDFF